MSNNWRDGGYLDFIKNIKKFVDKCALHNCLSLPDSFSLNYRVPERRVLFVAAGERFCRYQPFRHVLLTEIAGARAVCCACAALPTSVP